MNRTLMAVATTTALLAAPVAAQMGSGMGPGMMGGYGSQGMGPGMMGGYGSGGQGIGPGMMGPGIMGSYGGYGAVDLTDEQRDKIAEIQQEVSRKQWDVMAKMHEQSYRMQELELGGRTDDTVARKAYDAMSAAHKQMFEATLDARKRIDAVLTKEQREQLRRGSRGR